MEEEDKISWAKSYILHEIIEGCIVHDMRRLLEIEVKPSSYGNCNFPIALNVIATMDFLGYLIAEEKYNLRGNDTANRILAYIDVAFSEGDKEKFYQCGGNEFVIKQFRNGLVHEFFPKMGGVARGKGDLIQEALDGQKVLNADVLSEMFLDSIGRLREKFADDEFCVQVFDRIKSMQANNIQSIQKNNNPDITGSLSSSITTSTATTTTLLPDLPRE